MQTRPLQACSSYFYVVYSHGDVGFQFDRRKDNVGLFCGCLNDDANQTSQGSNQHACPTLMC